MFAFFRHRAYCHLFVALAAGIVLGHSWPLPLELLKADAGLMWFCLAGLALIWWTWRDCPSKLTYIPGFVMIGAVGFLAVSLAIRLPENAPLVDHVSGDPQPLVGKIASMPKYQRGHMRFLLQVERAGFADEEAAGLCYAYVKADAPLEIYMTDRVRLWASLSEVGPPLNRGEFDYRGYLLQRGTVLTAYALGENGCRRLSEGRPVPWAQISSLRAWLIGNLSRGLPDKYAELAVSVVYGDKITELPEEMETRFRRAGLTHILVASGTQVSLLIVLISLLFWRFTSDFSWRGMAKGLLQFAVTFAAVLLYASITGFETSIVRALAMGVLVLVGRLAHREADGLTTLAQSGLILLVVSPLQLFAPGFQLSFGATFGLIYIAGVAFPFFSRLKGWRYGLAAMFTTTVGAQVFVAPILAGGFNQISLWGFLSNLVAIPLAFALLIIGCAISIGAGYVPLLGWLIIKIGHGLCWFLDFWASLFAALPGSNLAVPSPPWWWAGAFLGAVLLAGEWIKFRGELPGPAVARLRLAVPAMAMALYAGLLWWALVPQPGLTALALKRCDAWIWRGYTGRSVLVARSSGISRSHNADKVTSALRSRGINRLHGVVWIDAAPEFYPFPDYPAPQYGPGDPLPKDWDLGWIGARGSPIGLRTALGDKLLLVLWKQPEAGTPLSVAAASPVHDFAALVANEQTWRELDAHVRSEVYSRGANVLVTTSRPWELRRDFPGVYLGAGETELYLRSGELRCRRLSGESYVMATWK